MFKKACSHGDLNFCSDKYLRVEVFSGPDTVCDVGLELPQEEKPYLLSRAHQTTGALYLDSCANESKCYTNASLTLFRKSANKFEFTIQRSSGYKNSKIRFRNISSTQASGPYKTHYFSRIIAP
jgi:hypothetical protein